MPCLNPCRGLLMAAMLAASALSAAAADSPLPARYRDLVIYTTSAPDPADAGKLVVTARFVNRGERPLELRATLRPHDQAGFQGGEFKGTVPGRGESPWTFELRPPAGLTYEVLEGEVAFGDRADRDLFIAVHGPAPEEKSGRGTLVEVPRPGGVVATYAPRKAASVQQSMREAAAARAGQPKITIAANGASKYRIQPHADAAFKVSTFDKWAGTADLKPSDREFFQAVEDLRRAIKLQADVELPVMPPIRESTEVGPFITIKQIRAPANWPHPDAYRLVIEGAEVSILASTADGLRNGIYGLLTDHLGVHWYTPGKLGEEIPVPADRTVALPADLDETRTPAFFSVTGMSWGASRDWDNRNRTFINRGRMAFGHAWASYLNSSDELYEQHPDWWARDREGNIRKFDRPSGSARTNFCSTHPEVIEIVAKGVNEYLDNNPDAIIGSLDPNDYAPMCLCDRCLALDKQYGQTREDGTAVADRLIHFSNEIKARLKDEHQDKYLGILIYGYQMDPPISAKAHDRYAGIICNMPWVYDHSRPFNDPTSPQNREFHDYVKAWGEAIPQMGFYDYYGHWQIFGPFAMIHKIREEMPAFREMGGTFILHEAQPNFGMHGLNHLVAARLAWDTEADIDALMEGYYTGFYGPAAEPMRAFWGESEKGYALLRPGPNTHQRFAALPGIWDRLEASLAAAAAAVAGTEVDQRFKDRIKLRRDAFDYGRWRWEFEQTYKASRIDALGATADRSGVADPQGAIRELREKQPWIETMQATYGENDEYWPPMLARYFWTDVNQLVGAIEAGQQAKQ